MKKFVKITSLYLFIMITVMSCSSDKQNPFSLQDLTKGDLGSVNHISAKGVQNEASFPVADSHIPTADELLIGQYKGDQSSILFKFGTVATDLDSATSIQKVDLILFRISQLGDTAQQSIPITIHNVTFSWDEETIDPPQVLNNYDPNPILTVSLLDSSDAAGDTLSLPTDILLGWIDGTIPNNGILMQSQVVDKIATYYSEETGTPPRIRVEYQVQGEDRVLSIAASEALSILQTDFQIPPNRLLIGSGIGYVSFFKIEQDTIPENATINRALLRFKVDTVSSIQGGLTLFQMQPNTLNWTADPAIIDSTKLDTVSYSGGNEVRVDFTPFLQDWIKKENTDFGLRLSPLDISFSLRRLVLYSSSADSAFKPQLDIYYSIPPNFNR